MNLKEYQVSPDEININPKVVARLLGIEGDAIPEPYTTIIDAEMEHIQDYDNMSGGFRIIDDLEIEPENHIFKLDGVEFNAGRQVTNYLVNAEKIALFVCTAGHGISQRSKNLMKDRQMLEGYVCDVIGSVLVEEAMTVIHNRLTEELAENRDKTTNRYSPGYCEWNVNEQHKLFSFFPPDFCGIKLSETALMHPIKSVSGVIGIGKNVKFHKYVCDACSNVNCIYRNLKYTV